MCFARGVKEVQLRLLKIRFFSLVVGIGTQKRAEKRLYTVVGDLIKFNKQMNKLIIYNDAMFIII